MPHAAQDCTENHGTAAPARPPCEHHRRRSNPRTEEAHLRIRTHRPLCSCMAHQQGNTILHRTAGGGDNGRL